MRFRRARSRGDNVARSALLIRGLLIVSIISVFQVLGPVKVSHHLSSVREEQETKKNYGKISPRSDRSLVLTTIFNNVFTKSAENGRWGKRPA